MLFYPTWPVEFVINASPVSETLVFEYWKLCMKANFLTKRADNFSRKQDPAISKVKSLFAYLISDFNDTKCLEVCKVQVKY